MVSKDKNLAIYEGTDIDFTIADYYYLKDYILIMSGNNYDYKKKKRLFYLLLELFEIPWAITINFFPKKRVEKNPELGILFESEEERNSFLNFYNIMCFCNSEEYLLLSEKNVVTREELRNVKIFFSNTGSFYPKKYVDEILELLGRIEYYNNTFLKNLKITGKVMK